ncbi:MAG: DUF4105 domain-containing protein [Acidobacteriota bacterium]
MTTEPTESSTERSWRQRLRLLPFLLLLGVGWAWVAGALYWFERWPPLVGGLAVLAWIAGTVTALLRLERRRAVLLLSAIGLGWMVVFLVVQRPRTDRAWSVDQERSLTVELVDDGRVVLLDGVRNFRHRSLDDVDVAWEQRRYELDDLSSLDLVVEPLPVVPGMAHVLLSFGFRDGRHLAISAEIRKEQGETYSPLAGMFRRYELAYVVADERDVLALRLNARGNDLVIHPLRGTPEQLRALFLAMLERAEELATSPEFYHSLGSTCASNLVRHFEDLRGAPLPLDWRVLLPVHSDGLAWDLELIDGATTLDEARTRHRVSGPVPTDGEATAFSRRVRAGWTG